MFPVLNILHHQVGYDYRHRRPHCCAMDLLVGNSSKYADVFGPRECYQTPDIDGQLVMLNPDITSKLHWCPNTKTEQR